MRRLVGWPVVCVLGVLLMQIPAALGQAAPPASSELSMLRGEMESLEVDGLERVLVADPAVADVIVISESQLFVKAKSAGRTDLFLWDDRGQQVIRVMVSDPVPAQVVEELRRVLSELGVTTVEVKQEGANVFLTGDVMTGEDRDRLSELLQAYPQPVTNLVRVLDPSKAAALPLVTLLVQVIELSRMDLEKLGIRWSDAISLTEPQATDQTLHDALVKWGTSLTRSSIAASLNALVQQNRARVLAEPKLVTGSGKEASSFIGTEVPIIESTSFGTGTGTAQASLRFRETGVLLKMTPTVLSDERIRTTLTAELSGIDTASGLTVPVGAQSVLVPGFRVRKTTTEVTTVSGETVVIAGLLEVEDSEGASQVPALGSVPILGRLFRSPEIKATQREVIIAVTPEVVAETPAGTARAAVLDDALRDMRQAGVAATQAITQPTKAPPAPEPPTPLPPEQTPMGAPATTEPGPALDDAKARYALQIHERIAKALRYPRERQEPYRVTLTLHVMSDGTLARALVPGSSAFDRAVLDTAQGVAPYPPFPTELQAQRELWFEIPVVFDPQL